MSVETMKIPEPIIEPATTAVASHRPRPRTNWGPGAEAAGIAPMALAALFTRPGRASLLPPAGRGCPGAVGGQFTVVTAVTEIDGHTDAEPDDQAGPVV